MRKLVILAFSGFVLGTSVYTFSASKARAVDWGCQVLLCISNPGGATQYPECRPPIERLWRHLARGHSFPICSSTGFTTTKPRYEPYYCDVGYQLVLGSNDRGRYGVGCASTEPQLVSNEVCRHRNQEIMEGRWAFENGKRVCKAVVIARPHVRKQPRYVDVTIDGVGKQRVWF